MAGQLKVGFLGYGTRGLDALMTHPDFQVNYFFAPRTRICQDVRDARERYRGRFQYAEVENNRDLAARFAQARDVDCFVMNACPIILNQEVLDRMDVFNIHPGNLENNRGHHPHLWTCLLYTSWKALRTGMKTVWKFTEGTGRFPKGSPLCPRRN